MVCALRTDDTGLVRPASFETLKTVSALGQPTVSFKKPLVSGLAGLDAREKRNGFAKLVALGKHSP